MPDLTNRSDFENRLAKLFGKEFQTELNEILASMGENPDYNSLPAGYWEELQKRIIQFASPALLETYLASAEQLMGTITIGADWALVNQNAINWVQKYGFDLVRGITDTTQGVLRSALEAYYRDGLDLQGLTDFLTPTFGPVRAEMIAITETTRAGVEGERGLVAMIERDNQNIKMLPIWQTANDDRVCPICGPRHGQYITDGMFPPAHPRCRCWTNWEMTVIK